MATQQQQGERRGGSCRGRPSRAEEVIEARFGAGVKRCRGGPKGNVRRLLLTVGFEAAHQAFAVLRDVVLPEGRREVHAELCEGPE